MFTKITVGLVLFIGALEFYWYGYRPKQIRAKCEAQAIETASATYRDKTNYEVQAGYATGSYRLEDKQHYYATCLRHQGI
jgi:hypothetical protein